MRSLGTTGIANSRDRLRRCSRVGGARGCGNRLWQRQASSGTAESTVQLHPFSNPSHRQRRCFALLAPLLSRSLFPPPTIHFTLFIPYRLLHVPSRSHTTTEMRFLQPLATPAVLSLLSSVAGAYGLAATRRATVCNGHAEVRRVYIRIQ